MAAVRIFRVLLRWYDFFAIVALDQYMYMEWWALKGSAMSFGAAAAARLSKCR